MRAQHLDLSLRGGVQAKAGPGSPSLLVVHLLPGSGEVKETCPLAGLKQADLAMFDAQGSYWCEGMVEGDRMSRSVGQASPGVDSHKNSLSPHLQVFLVPPSPAEDKH